MRARTMRRILREKVSTVALLIMSVLYAPNVASAQELGPDRAAEAEYFRNAMEASSHAASPRAVDSSRSPQLVDPREAGDSSATVYGVAPAHPPFDLPFELSSDLSLPFGIASLSNEEILGYIAYYCTDGRRQLSRWIARSGRYEEIILAEAQRQGAPLDVLWVVAVESGFDPFAVSSAGAVGLWQFMPRTGRYLGLRIGGGIDERKDPFVSTAYGIHYLMELRDMFESWPLALAAYNAGLGHVRGELRRANANDFEKLDDYQAIYSNARNYAGRIIAIATILRNREHFGFDAIVKDAPLDWDEVQVSDETTFSRIAQWAGTDRDTIASLNPQFTRSATLANETSTVRIPAGSFASYVSSTTSDWDENVQTYPLRFGETIDGVADRYGVSPYVVRAMNDLGSRESAPYGMVIELPADASQRVTQQSERSVVILPEIDFEFADRVRVFYEIQPGDSLLQIASHFAVDRYRLAAWNDLDPAAALWSGMILQVFVPVTVDLGETVYLTESDIRPMRLFSEEYWDYRRQEQQRNETSARSHTVRRGDTVIGIANRYGVRSRDIIRWNDLDDDGQIFVGQELRVAR